ncbi:hypothetical protein Glove_89g57 [Diversispora epigaea]|uniref:Uncharacterized protein n=1 Tax=Diversispora epigaea TaxID=1348612 RepID=A0A397JEQ1_9GLOM|nr:hypothetical protein Glove_89g57 [Diversispora epigaea]
MDIGTSSDDVAVICNMIKMHMLTLLSNNFAEAYPDACKDLTDKIISFQKFIINHPSHIGNMQYGTKSKPTTSSKNLPNSIVVIMHRKCKKQASDLCVIPDELTSIPPLDWNDIPSEMVSKTFKKCVDEDPGILVVESCDD